MADERFHLHGRRNFLGAGNDEFTCLVCGTQVLPLRNGSFRSHCPECLWSRHVDDVPGDRASSCGGLMEPIALEGSAAGGWSVVHACRRCGARKRNRTAEDDPRQPDRWERMMEVSAGGGGAAAPGEGQGR
jgi:hypothetical protein